MPKKIGQFCTAIIIGGGFELSVFAATLGDFCVSNGVNCWWCAEGGDSGSFCDRGYAGCLNTDQIVIYAGGTVTDSSGNRRRCSSSGFCFENCNWVTNIEYRYIDLGGGYSQVESNNSGCLCNEWGRTTSVGNAGYVCSAGYYGESNSYGSSGCTRCPTYTNMAGESFYGDSNPADNENIADCWLDGENGPFSDSTGEYDITTDKCAYVPYTINPPGGGTVVTPPGGTIITPVV